MKKIILLLGAALTTIVLIAGLGAVLASHVVPTVMEGNRHCADIGLSTVLVVDGPFPLGAATIVDFVGGAVTITFQGEEEEATILDWESTIAISAVIVKGGPAVNIYRYDPPSFEDTGLHSPSLLTRGGSLPSLSHVEFCFDEEILTVTPTSTDVPTVTPMPTDTQTPAPAPTVTKTPTPTATLTVTDTPTPTPIDTDTPVPTPSALPTSTDGPTPILTPTGDGPTPAPTPLAFPPTGVGGDVTQNNSLNWALLLSGIGVLLVGIGAVSWRQNA